MAFAANKDVCLTLLQRCADYGVKLIGLPSVALPTPPRVMASVAASHDLWERTMRLRSKMTGVSTENAASIQGLSLYQVTSFDDEYHRHKCLLGSGKFNASYKKALSLEQKATFGLNTLLEILSSWAMITDSHGLPDDEFPDVITLEKLHELWEKTRYTMGLAVVLKNEPASQLFYRSTVLSSTRPLSVMKRWMVDLVRFS